ncbi:hypothetical protein [Streptomyces violens]|uniref:hypothetical protein n=1 Tax=Streptomyces violens TaxID=66377 RepID=UPI0004BFFC83|nr:hypothetical protein [Streptomyces violens]
MTDQRTGERPAEAAPGRARVDLRPYLPNREVVGALFTGSAALIGRGWAWITAEDWKEALARLGYVGAGGYVAAYLAWTHPAYGMPVAVVGWCAAAWMHAPSPPPAERPASFDEDDDQEELELDEDQEDASPTPELVAALVRKLAGAEHQGAHLDDLIATGALGDWEKADLKAALLAWGVPVEEGLKLRFNGRQRVRMGVRVRDLPAALGEAPTGAGEGAPPAPAPATAEHPPAAAA